MSTAYRSGRLPERKGFSPSISGGHFLPRQGFTPRGLVSCNRNSPSVSAAEPGQRGRRRSGFVRRPEVSGAYSSGRWSKRGQASDEGSADQDRPWSDGGVGSDADTVSSQGAELAGAGLDQGALVNEGDLGFRRLIR